MSADKTRLNRRLFLGATAASVGGLAAPALAQSANSIEFENTVTEASRNISSFRALDWRPYFSNTRNGAILADVTSRAVH